MISVEASEPDVITLDLSMPVMDGRTFYRELRQRGHRGTVLIVSASKAREVQRELAADDYLSKPFDLNDVVEHVEALAKLSAA